MEKQARMDTQRAWVYRKSYRPSTNVFNFFRNVLIVLVEGQSPSASHHPYYKKKR